MTTRKLPPTPFFEDLIITQGSLTVFDKYFDSDMNLLPCAPEELVREIELLRSVEVVKSVV